MIKPLHPGSWIASLKYTLMGALILIFLIFIIAITTLSFIETRNTIEDSFSKEQNNSEKFLTESVLYINRGLKLWDTTYDNDLCDALLTVRNAYERSGNVSHLNLTAVRESMKPELRDKIDLYLINESGIIIQTTCTQDLHLDFRKWPEFYQDVTRMREGERYVSDRVVRGFISESPLKKYGYLPTRDNRFLLQISRNVEQDYQDERSSLSYELLVKTVIEGDPDLKSVLIYNSFHNITLGNSFFPEEKPDERTDSILTQVFSTHNQEIYTDKENKTISHYVFIEGQKDDSPSSKYMNRVGNFTYSTEQVDEQVRTTLFLHLVIALISVIIGLFFAYGLTRRITSPVDRIIEDIDHISGGDLNYPLRSTGQSELIRLEHSIAHMVERLKNHIRYLNVSESRYHILFNSSYDPILLLREMTIIDSNQAAKRIFPELNGESGSINLVDIFTLSDSSEEKEELFNRLVKTAKENGTIEEEYPFILSDCSVHHLMMRFTAVFVEDTTHIHLLIQDITDRKLAWKTHLEDEALKESYRQIQIIIDLLPDPTFAINAQGEIILWNHAMEEISGMKGSDVLGKAERIYALPLYGTIRPTLVDLILDPSLESTEVYPQITRKGRVLSDEIFIDNKNDGGSYYSAVASPLYDSNGGLIGAVETVRDITSRVKAERAIVKMNQKLNLLSGITRHDIKNRISVLVGVSNLIKDSCNGPESKQLLIMLETSVEAIKKQIDFTGDYQDLGIFSPQWQDIGLLLNRVSGEIDHGSIQILNHFTGIQIYADPLLERVLFNIIDNAVRYGGPITTITTSWNIVDNSLKITIADDGTGILFIEKERIFEPGYGKGTGLGLFLVREILSITDISILETGVGREGARFEIMIPPGGFRFSEDARDFTDSKRDGDD